PVAAPGPRPRKSSRSGTAARRRRVAAHRRADRRPAGRAVRAPRRGTGPCGRPSALFPTPVVPGESPGRPDGRPERAQKPPRRAVRPRRVSLLQRYLDVPDKPADPARAAPRADGRTALAASKLERRQSRRSGRVSAGAARPTGRVAAPRHLLAGEG